MSAAPYSLNDLVTALNLDAVRARYLSGLQGAGFPALTQWVPKDGVEMAYVDMVSGSATDLIAADLPFLIAGGFLGKAAEIGADEALDLLAETVYLLKRVAASFTTFKMTLSCASTAGPYSLDPGDVTIVAASGNHYVSTTGGSLESDGSLTLAFQASTAGAAFADDPALGGFRLGTTLAGVTMSAASPPFSGVVLVGSSSGQIIPGPTDPDGGVTPHAYVVRIDVTGDTTLASFSVSTDGGAFEGRGVLQAATDIGEGCTLTAIDGNGTPSSFVAGDTFTFRAPGGPSYAQGSDKESNLRLATRCRSRWQALSRNPTRGLIRLWIALVAPQASRLRLSVDPVVPARVLADLADAHGPADQNLVNAIVAFVAPRIGPFTTITGRPAAAVTITPSGDVTVTPSTKTAVQAAAQEAWVVYNGDLDLGGVVRIAELVRAIEDAGGTVRQPNALLLNGVAANLQLPAGSVPMPASIITSMTWVYG